MNEYFLWRDGDKIVGRAVFHSICFQERAALESKRLVFLGQSEHQPSRNNSDTIHGFIRNHMPGGRSFGASTMALYSGQ